MAAEANESLSVSEMDTGKSDEPDRQTRNKLGLPPLSGFLLASNELATSVQRDSDSVSKEQALSKREFPSKKFDQAKDKHAKKSSPTNVIESMKSKLKQSQLFSLEKALASKKPTAVAMPTTKA